MDRVAERSFPTVDQVSTEPTSSVKVNSEAGNDRATGSCLAKSQGQIDFDNWADTMIIKIGYFVWITKKLRSRAAELN